MPSVDDFPEQLDPDFGGYDQDTPYQQNVAQMAYFKLGSLSGMTTYGNLQPPTSKEVISYEKLRKDVESGDDKAIIIKQYQLAWHHEHGIDFKLSNIMHGQRTQDYKRAVELYKMVSQTDHYLASRAMHQIGVLYEKGGYGINQDYLEASKWYLKDIKANGENMAVLGYDRRSSHLTLARLYIEGLGVEENHTKAIEILSSLESIDSIDDDFPRFTDDANSNESLKYYLFSQLYGDNSDGGILGKTYGWGVEWKGGREDGYLISKDSHEALWKKWLKKAINLDYGPAIIDYASHLDRAMCLQLDRGRQEYKESTIQDLKDSIRSLYYYKRAHQLGNEWAESDYNEALNNIVNEISKAYTIVLDGIEESKQNESIKAYQDIINKALLDSPDVKEKIQLQEVITAYKKTLAKTGLSTEEREITELALEDVEQELAELGEIIVSFKI